MRRGERSHRRISLAARAGDAPREKNLADSVYKVIELVGTSEQSWEMAAKTAVERAAATLRDLRIAEVVEQDLVIDDGAVTAFRTKVKVSFKFDG